MFVCVCATLVMVCTVLSQNRYNLPLFVAACNLSRIARARVCAVVLCMCVRNKYLTTACSIVSLCNVINRELKH